jgi:uncharacterized protein (TIGR02145 family)
VNWTSGGIEVSTAESFTFTVTQDSALVANFEIKTYTISAEVSDSNGGTIEEAGDVMVDCGTNKTFTFIPNTGYHIEEVLVDGTSNPSAVASGNYTFTYVTDNHTISVTFAINTYTITPTAGPNGTINPSVLQSINYGSSQTFTFTPNSGYEVEELLIDGVSVPDSIPFGSYSFVNVTANHTIAVTFIIVCPDSITDGDGNDYPVVRLARMCWMAANMRARTYNDGTTLIPFAKPYYHPQYPDSVQNEIDFGLLYDYASIFPVPTRAGNLSICPDGWHIPTSAEWALLNTYLVENLKNPIFWIQPNTNTNITKFNFCGAGLYNGALQRFEKLFGYTAYWSSDLPTSTTCIVACLNHICSQIEFIEIKLTDAISVRCVYGE